MNNNHDSNQDEPGMEFQRKPENHPELMAEFTKAIAAYGQAEQAEAAALQMFCLASEEAERNPSPELLLAAQARACEERRAWAEAESCLTSQSLNASLAQSDTTGPACLSRDVRPLALHKGPY